MSAKHKKGFYERYVKFPQDFVLAIILLIILSPVMLIIAILVRVKLGSPIIFKQERAGKDGKPFRMYKFRSMSNEKDSNGYMLADEKRLEKFGKTLRSTSLDELPSLFNVVLGNISFVGPRSLYLSYNSRYNKTQKRRLEVRPGITGLAQVNGRNSISWKKKFEYDIQYIDNITFINDWQIMLQTIPKVLKREGITSNSSVTMEEFTGNK